MSTKIPGKTKERAGIDSLEVAYVLLGEYQNGLWHARLNWRSRGTETSVLFDGSRVLEREEERGDVVGFFHTHPEGFTAPSSRDDKTMRAWSFCFGKPLLCVIGTSAGLRAWVYDYQVDGAIELGRIARFKGNWILGSDR